MRVRLSPAGADVTQATSKSTGVTLHGQCGVITMNNAALAAATTVSFTLTNDRILSARDLVVVNIASGPAAAGSYTVTVDAVAAGSCSISLRNETAGSLSEAVVLNVGVINAGN